MACSSIATYVFILVVRYIAHTALHLLNYSIDYVVRTYQFGFDLVVGQCNNPRHRHRFRVQSSEPVRVRSQYS